MKIQKINPSPITNEDITKYKELVQQREGMLHTANDVGMDKRIITFRVDTKDNELTLVNPVVLKGSDKPVVYFERDDEKPGKIRKVVRHPYLVIETDNLGKVEFKSDKIDWKSADDFMEDAGLFECVQVQKLLDAIDGIKQTSSLRAYKETVSVTKQPGRNERVMLQGPNGEMEFVKNKKVDEYLQTGWSLI
jgi:hypothetical protein